MSAKEIIKALIEVAMLMGYEGEELKQFTAQERKRLEEKRQWTKKRRDGWRREKVGIWADKLEMRKKLSWKSKLKMQKQRGWDYKTAWSSKVGKMSLKKQLEIEVEITRREAAQAQTQAEALKMHA